MRAVVRQPVADISCFLRVPEHGEMQGQVEAWSWYLVAVGQKACVHNLEWGGEAVMTWWAVEHHLVGSQCPVSVLWAGI